MDELGPAHGLRVVHIVTAFQRHEDDVITPWLTALVSAQRARGIDASILTPSYRGLASQHIVGIPVDRFRYAPRSWETLTHDETVPDRLSRSPQQAALLPSYMAAGLWASVRSGRAHPDVVHVHWPVPHALFGAAARFASGGRAALVCTFYSVEISWVERRARWLRPLLAWSARTADAVTAISSATAARLEELVDRDVCVIPFAAAVPMPAGEGRPALADARSLHLLFVGRLVQRKGVEYLVEALARVREARPAELTIVGEGEWKGRIQEVARRAGVERFVRFEGYVSDKDLRAYYEACDIFVLPAVIDSKGDTEGLGVVLIEAMGFARPVIGSDVGGITDIIQPGETGWLVRPADPAALAETILRVADDPEQAREVARAGRAFVETSFSIERITEELETVYHAGLSVRSRARARRS
jgi:glycosyltransferase involved in cell wall biosynthesis